MSDNISPDRVQRLDLDGKLGAPSFIERSLRYLRGLFCCFPDLCTDSDDSLHSPTPVPRNALFVLAPYNMEEYLPAQLVMDESTSSSMQTVRFYHTGVRQRVLADAIIWDHGNLVGIYVYYITTGGSTVGLVRSVQKTNEHGVPELFSIKNENREAETVTLDAIIGLPPGEIERLMRKMDKGKPVVGLPPEPYLKMVPMDIGDGGECSRKKRSRPSSSVSDGGKRGSRPSSHRSGARSAKTGSANSVKHEESAL